MTDERTEADNQQHVSGDEAQAPKDGDVVNGPKIDVDAGDGAEAGARADAEQGAPESK